ncbi:MAG: hypothetical protein JWQ89_2633 [Devosia sp.]|nr:hypothetical protein [Devosia sp.]
MEETFSVDRRYIRQQARAALLLYFAPVRFVDQLIRRLTMRFP